MVMKLILTYFTLVGIALSEQKPFNVPLEFGRFDENCVYQSKNKIIACHQFNQLMTLSTNSPSQYRFIKSKHFVYGLTALHGKGSIVYAGFTNGMIIAYNLKTKKLIFKKSLFPSAIKSIHVLKHGEFISVGQNGQIKYFENQVLKYANKNS